uniref:Layilin a n=1 Tax=Oryzias latipes TaxID=8090 RepID=A0A3P9KGM4_ORYLA
MDLLTFLFLLLFCFDPSAGKSLITADIFEARGQRVCRAGKGKPCYKLAYFSELRWKLNFVEADLACKRDGGQLLSVESESEQKIIEQLITELRPTDGDFWIGLRRNDALEDNIPDCPSQYYWLDGSRSTFRNWHFDEPSCGSEVCVVLYHQPSAPPGLGGPYMFQWNDDNCETKNNFICKYTAERSRVPALSPNATLTDALPSPELPEEPNYPSQNRTAMNLVYVIIPTIPLLLLLLTVMGVCCFKMLITRRRKQKKPEVGHTDSGPGTSPTSTDVYNIIRSQKDDDLLSTRPQTKNTSFLCSSPDTPTGDYDNLGGRDTESGFVTLASTESCLLTFDLNEHSLGRRGPHDYNNMSLGRLGKRDLNDSSLSRLGNREFYDRSLGRRTTKSEHYSHGSMFGENGLYNGTVRAASELDELRPGSHTGKFDLYQTYVSNGKHETFQTSLGTYGNRKSFHTNLDNYRNRGNLDSGHGGFTDHEWIVRGHY